MRPIEDFPTPPRYLRLHKPETETAMKDYVVRVIDSELAYQKWNEDSERSRSVGEWLLLIEYYLERAKFEWNQHRAYDVLAEIRKITAAGAAAMEQHGAHQRLS